MLGGVCYINKAPVGSHNARRTLFLGNDADWQSFTQASPEVAEILASRRYATEEIARLYGLPPPLISDYTNNTFTKAETASRWFAQTRSVIGSRRSRRRFRRGLRRLTVADNALEIDLSVLLRGDDTLRWQSYQIARQNGILTVDEIRQKEGFNPLPPGNAPAPTIG